MTKERNGLDSGKKDKLGKRLPKKKEKMQFLEVAKGFWRLKNPMESGPTYLRATVGHFFNRGSEVSNRDPFCSMMLGLTNMGWSERPNQRVMSQMFCSGYTDNRVKHG